MFGCIFFLGILSSTGFSATIIQQSNSSDGVLAPEISPLEISDLFSSNDSSSIELDGPSLNQSNFTDPYGLDLDDVFQYPDLIDATNDEPKCDANSYGRNLNKGSCSAALAKIGSATQKKFWGQRRHAYGYQELLPARFTGGEYRATRFRRALFLYFVKSRH